MHKKVQFLVGRSGPLNLAFTQLQGFSVERGPAAGIEPGSSAGGRALARVARRRL